MYLYTHTLLTLHTLCHTKNRTNNYHISILLLIKPYDTSTLRSVTTKTEPVVYAVTSGRQGHELFTHNCMPYNTFALEREMLNYCYVFYALYYLTYGPDISNGCLLRQFNMYLALMLQQGGYFIYCYVISIHANIRGTFSNMLCNVMNKCYTCNSLVQVMLTYFIRYDALAFLTHIIICGYLTGILILLNRQCRSCLTQTRLNLTKSNCFASSSSCSFTSTQFILING